MRYVSGLAQHPTMTTPLPHLAPEQLLRLVTLAMPFGKYKGRVIADLPGHYLNWFAREGFPKGELGRLLALMQEIDHNGLTPPARSAQKVTTPPQAIPIKSVCD